MQSKAFSIATVSFFVLGVVAWYGARYFEFGKFRVFSLIPIVLAIALANRFLRGDVLSRWLTLAFGLLGAYSSFNLFLYIQSKPGLIESEGITGEAFILPGALFSLCSGLLMVTSVADYFRKKRAAE